MSVKLRNIMAIIIYVILLPIVMYISSINPYQWVVIIAWIFPLAVLFFAVVITSEAEIRKMAEEHKRKKTCAG